MHTRIRIYLYSCSQSQSNNREWHGQKMKNSHSPKKLKFFNISKREMGTLSILPLSCPPPSAFPSSFCSRTHLSKPISSPRLTFENPRPTNLRTKTVVFGASSRDPDEHSQFLDENGEVEDMDGYLNYLSLEYESVWDTKPSWCQPWTITLTGLLAIVCSWLTLQSTVVTSIVTLLMCSWWYIFLYSYPKEYSAMIAERRKRVTNGTEDTFGRRKSQ